MLTVRFDWFSPGFPNYSVYTAEHYVVSQLQDGTFEILLDKGALVTHHIILGKGSTMYVMNDNGATIDRLKN